MANQGITRRDFIKGLAAGAVGLAGIGALKVVESNARNAAASAHL